ncbi:MAG TPA: hypothetical protein VFC21_12480, partial [Bryobacteraceae bacterium]|nr:hypothetical protein [Bryobacteraceae bacterium]
MKKPFLLFAIILPLWGQGFDFKSLDKFDTLTQHKTKVTLDGDLLKLAARFLGGDDDKETASIKSLVDNLKGIYIRSWEFDRDGQYTQADIEPLRVYL